MQKIFHRPHVLDRKSQRAGCKLPHGNSRLLVKLVIKDNEKRRNNLIVQRWYCI